MLRKYHTAKPGTENDPVIIAYKKGPLDKYTVYDVYHSFLTKSPVVRFREISGEYPIDQFEFFKLTPGCGSQIPFNIMTMIPTIGTVTDIKRNEDGLSITVDRVGKKFSSSQEQIQTLPRICECGVDRTGGGLHSDWCPKGGPR